MQSNSQICYFCSIRVYQIVNSYDICKSFRSNEFLVKGYAFRVSQFAHFTFSNHNSVKIRKNKVKIG